MSFLKPIPTYSTSTGQVLYRMPLFKDDDTFVVWLDEGEIRYFDTDTLPACIKVQLGIIMNSPYAADLNLKDSSVSEAALANIQENLGKNPSKDPAYEDIGWQYDSKYYCIVLNEEELASVKR